MSQAAPRQEPGSSRATACLISVSDCDIPDGVVLSLEREAIEVLEVASGSLPATVPSTSVAVIWLSAPCAETELRAVIKWARGSSAPLGLIGCCPGGERGDVELALASGFDDILLGAVSIRELAARVRALSRRISMASARLGTDSFGNVSLDLERHEAWVGGDRVTLTPTELSVMRALVSARGRAITRAEILDAAWGDQSFEIGERAVDNVIMRLRSKLEDRDAIVTVRGVGFRLADPI